MSRRGRRATRGDDSSATRISEHIANAGYHVDVDALLSNEAWRCAPGLGTS